MTSNLIHGDVCDVCLGHADVEPIMVGGEPMMMPHDGPCDRCGTQARILTAATWTMRKPSLLEDWCDTFIQSTEGY